ncbi:MAG: recombination mediator RecR [Armatimonadota bacterium]|jgi:recombination protein RecR
MEGAHPRPLAQLIEELQKLPGIGPKSAQRLAFHILRAPEADCRGLADAIIAVRTQMRFCARCHNFTDAELCRICSDPRRDASTVCVVGEPAEVIALERAGVHRGVYHVLQGLLAPLDGMGPENIRIGELLARVKEGGISEVIVATSPTTEGEATAEYIQDVLKEMGVKVTRIGRGIPIGADLDYVDQVSIAHALEGRTPM